MHTERQQAAAARRFAEKWQGKGYEKGDSQIFWTELLTEVYGIEDPSTFIRFEEQVKVDKTNFIDVHLPQTKVIIEQKSIGKDLRAPIRQSDGSLLTPFQQGKRYNAELAYSQRARWIVTCNFREFLVYDMEQPNSEPEQILLENLGKEYYRLRFLVDSKSEHLSKEMQVSMKAGEIVGKLYDELLKQYIDPTNEHSLKSLNILCVRLVFCLYAEDAGIFGRHDMFHDFLNNYPTEELRNALIRLFKVMDTPPELRDPYMREDLLAFPYTNGGLFADEQIEIPRMTDTIRELLLENASLDFDWSEISPTIFGAVFESTLNPETRRSGGMHYTSIENIHKVIDPLFLDDLRSEFDSILEEKVERQRNRKLESFQDKLASLTFLDPACGSGNFLTETYLSLRRLENEVIRERYHGQSFLGFEEVNPIKVNIGQFYGIEINDFAVTVATTALWISEAQMLAETERIIRRDIDFLPLKTYTNIREGNALRIDWESVVAKERLNYIIGNPPFVGARIMNEEQKQDVIAIFGTKWKNVGNLDYVCCWYKKAAELLKSAPHARAALVSTNSICQGEQVASLWQPLMGDGLRIDFAYRTFRWDSEASQKAHVHCVIVGFSNASLSIASSSAAVVTNSPSNLRGGRGALTSATEHVMNTPDMKSLRRTLRSNGTSAEGALWKILRAKQVGGLQFRRQFSVGRHILDFYCPALKLGIELDGDYHYHGAMPEHDQYRDEELLQEYGVRMLRFENKLVFLQPEAIVNSILQIQAEAELGVGIGRVNAGSRVKAGSVNAPQPPLILEGELVTTAPVIYDGERTIKATNINAYLTDAPNVFIVSRPRPLCDVPEIGIGNQPIDGGNYLFEREEMEAFVKSEPLSAQYFHPWYGAVEFLHQKPRYCLWLGGCSPAELRKMPHCMQRIENVRTLRLASNRAATRKLADTPTHFQTENMPKGNFIIIPKVSSERRRYVPMGFMSPEVMASDLVFLIPDASLYHFGILESNVHMAWMRQVCGRLKSDYRYSKDVVYNNFPWPMPTEIQRHKIEQTAQAILDARNLYPESSLADLYDELTMPPELRKAHQQNDRAVMEAYGFPVKNEFTESLCVAELFKLYQKLTQSR